jgi:hypothetical protein
MESMNRSTLLIPLFCLLTSPLAYSNDHGFPTLNTMGRYLGVGWSHHTYHSKVDGRFNVITNRHPACEYPSSSLTHVYDAGYTNYPPRNFPLGSSSNFWQAPTPSVVEQKSKAPQKVSVLESEKGENSSSRKVELDTQPEIVGPEQTKPEPAFIEPPKPKEPPPSWLKPFLDQDKRDDEALQIQSSPSDKTSAASSVNRYR